MAVWVVLWVVCFWVSVFAVVPGRLQPGLGGGAVVPGVLDSLSGTLSWNVQNTWKYVYMYS